jgi:ABC-type multidrug transport system fused ATPase/permease subunit
MALTSMRLASAAWPRALAAIRKMQTLIWPLSKRSAASWIIIVGALYAVWVKTFVHWGVTNTIKEEKAKECSRLTELMRAVLLYADAERSKPESERKMPEARRVYTLLWDETFTCSVTRYGIKPTDAHYVSTQELLQETLHDELRKCIDLTRTAREMRLPATRTNTEARQLSTNIAGVADSEQLKATAMEKLKAIAEHESGEKLKNVVSFAEQVKRNLGTSFVRIPQLREARTLKKAVFRQQSRNTKMLSTLVRPLLPNITLVMALSAWRGIGRGVFHQIRYWSDSIEMASKGDVAGAGRMLLFVWAGHILLQVTEYLELTFSKDTESRLGQSVRNGVLESMVRQDYEYFDKNSAGILQERLNRDANELGNNMVRDSLFPCRRTALSALCIAVRAHHQL